MKLPITVVEPLHAAHPQNLAGFRMVMCETVARGNMNFSLGRVSSLDSQISYRTKGGEIRYGRIFQILGELQDGRTAVIKRSFVLVERYTPLSPVDEPKDPYWRHSLVGKDGYQMCRAVYYEFMEGMDTIRAEDIIGHIAICPLDDSDQTSFTSRAIVTVQLDRVRRLVFPLSVFLNSPSHSFRLISLASFLPISWPESTREYACPILYLTQTPCPLLTCQPRRRHRPRNVGFQAPFLLTMKVRDATWLSAKWRALTIPLRFTATAS